MLNWLIESEEVAKNNIRKSEEEVKSILNDRTHEETVSELTVSIYDTERNQKARQYKIDIVSFKEIFPIENLIVLIMFYDSSKKRIKKSPKKNCANKRLRLIIWHHFWLRKVLAKKNQLLSKLLLI
jgi:hypothetical protein